MPNELKGMALLDYYQEAVRACYGGPVQASGINYHNRGWYHLAWWDKAYRAAQVREMADELLKRVKEE